jgi:pilus assembly protein CpaB
MKKSRLLFLAFVIACGGAAAFLVLDRPEPAAPVALAAPAAPQEQALVAAHDLSFGAVIQPGDLLWQNWPRDSTVRGILRKSESPNAIDEVKDSVLRGAFLSGEPIRREKLFKGANSGFLSAILAPGFRAVAIAIDGGGSTTAGNFVLPNDRVDVIHIYRDEDAARTGAGDAYVSETLVANVRVLAIGQNAQDKGGQPFASGSTATLELDPHQAEKVILAQRVGQLSLVLRSMQDGRETGGPISPMPESLDRSVTVVRAGVASQSRGK